jgi:hypothetical protein
MAFRIGQHLIELEGTAGSEQLDAQPTAGLEVVSKELDRLARLRLARCELERGLPAVSEDVGRSPGDERQRTGRQKGENQDQTRNPWTVPAAKEPGRRPGSSRRLVAESYGAAGHAVAPDVVHVIRPWIVGLTGLFAVTQSATALSMMSRVVIRLAKFG